MVARIVRDDEVVGSNPTTPTILRSAERSFGWRSHPNLAEGQGKDALRSPGICLQMHRTQEGRLRL